MRGDIRGRLVAALHDDVSGGRGPEPCQRTTKHRVGQVQSTACEHREGDVLQELELHGTLFGIHDRLYWDYLLTRWGKTWEVSHNSCKIECIFIKRNTFCKDCIW